MNLSQINLYLPLFFSAFYFSLWSDVMCAEMYACLTVNTHNNNKTAHIENLNETRSQACIFAFAFSHKYYKTARKQGYVEQWIYSSMNKRCTLLRCLSWYVEDILIHIESKRKREMKHICIVDIFSLYSTLLSFIEMRIKIWFAIKIDKYIICHKRIKQNATRILIIIERLRPWIIRQQYFFYFLLKFNTFN